MKSPDRPWLRLDLRLWKSNASKSFNNNKRDESFLGSSEIPALYEGTWSITPYLIRPELESALLSRTYIRSIASFCFGWRDVGNDEVKLLETTRATYFERWRVNLGLIELIKQYLKWMHQELRVTWKWDTSRGTRHPGLINEGKESQSSFYNLNTNTISHSKIF